MPSTVHEGIIALLRNRPELLDRYARLPHPRQSPETEWNWQSDPSELTIVSPVELRADAVIKRVPKGSDKPDLVVIFEVQRDRKKDKRRKWSMYLGSALCRYDCPTVLVVVCPDPGVAEWARQEYRTNVEGFTVRPIVIGPDDVPAILDPRDAAYPEQTVLSALMHGSRPPDIRRKLFAALADVMRTLPRDQVHTYTNVVYNTISRDARVDLKEAYMSLTYDEPSLFKDIADEARKQGEACGEARGEATSVLKVLDARGVTVPQDVRERITQCRDSETLDLWLVRAVTADRIEDVLDPDES